MGRDQRRKTVKVVKRYSEALKLQVVEEFERGESRAVELVEHYAIGCPRTVYRWCRKYGRLTRATKIVRVIMKSEKALIKELKETIAELTLENRFNKALWEVYEEDYKLGKVKKKLSTEQLKRLESLKAQLAALGSKNSVVTSE
jgi:transposase-like protein